MASIALEDTVSKFQSMANTNRRIGVSDFARSKEWRTELPHAGCLEVVDHGNVIGYMLAPDWVEAISNRITELEEQLEQAQITAMFSSRADRKPQKSGKQLEKAALEYFDKHAAAFAEIASDAQ